MTAAPVTIDEAFAVPADDHRLQRAADALREHDFTVHIVDTVVEARTLVRDLLPRDKEIFTALSETLRLSGIAEDIEQRDGYQSLRKRLEELADDPPAKFKAGAAPDVVIGSVHAVTETGQLVAASATGSQLAGYAAGARQAIWVVGAQKVVADLDTALRRVRTYSLPREIDRLSSTGWESFIGKILIVERELLPDRGTVVLIREPIGF